MKWSRAQLLKQKKAGLEIDEVVNLEYLKKREPQILSISPIHVKGRADISSEKATFYLSITGEMVLPSSRTLREVKFPLDIQSVETFLFESDEDLPIDAESHIVEGDTINLYPVVEELVLLEIPIQIYSDEDDLIPPSQLSGKDWEFIQEEDLWQREKIDPRMRKLAKLLNNDGK